MQGKQDYQPQLFSMVNLEELIPERHLLRRIDRLIDFSFVRELTKDLYCEENGRPSIDPELFFRITLLTYFYNVDSDRQVCEEIQYNLAYRWFCRLAIEDKVPDHSSLTRIRDRLGENIFRQIFEGLVAECVARGFVKINRVMMDGSLIKADAALNSMVEKDEGGNPNENEEPPKYIFGRKFSNKTHASRTDPDATLAGKMGEPKQLLYKLHNTIDRETRFVVDAHVTEGSAVEGKVGLERLDYIEET